MEQPEEKYRAIFDNAPIGIYQSTPEGRFLNVNCTLARQFGYHSPEEVIASVTDIPRQIFVKPEQRSELIGRAVASEGFVQREVEYRRRDGSCFIANLHLRVVRDNSGDIAYLEGFVEDITERKRAEEALKNQFKQISTILDELNVVVYVIDPATNELLALNRYGTTIFGNDWQKKPCHQVINCSEPCTSHIVPDATPAHVPDTQQTFFCKNRVTGRWYQTVKKEITWIDGKRVYVVVSVDVSDLKEMDRMKSEVISIVSHEIRTPLTAMHGFTEFLLQNRVSEEELHHYLRTMQNANERLDELLSNLLELKYLKDRPKNEEIGPLPLRPVLDEVTLLYTKQDRIHRLRLEVPSDLPPVMITATNLHRIMANLLSNAVKFSPQGGEIVLGAYREADETVTVWVKDEGIGIPPEVLDKIFSRFYQVDSGDRRTFGGTGLGLALVKELVTACGGRIRVESSLGKGSTFFLSLPIAGEPAGAARSLT